MGVIAKKEEGVVVRVKCNKPGIPNPSRIFAMKIMTNILDTSSLTHVSDTNCIDSEYKILFVFNMYTHSLAIASLFITLSGVCLNRNYSLLQVRSKFRNEYDILSGLPPHDNIVKLFAFFYDRPKAYPKLKQCGEGIALCMLMEQLSQNMQEHINSLRRANGPMVSDIRNIIVRFILF